MTKQEKEFINVKIDVLNERIESGNNIILLELDLIKQQTIKTNGRVTCLEEETKVVRFFSKRPVLAFLIFIGIILLIGVIGLPELFTIIK
jgi:hypothetical protein